MSRIKVENPIVELDGDEMTALATGMELDTVRVGLVTGVPSSVPSLGVEVQDTV